MPEDVEIRSFYDIPIAHFPDKSARWLLQNKENVRGLLEIVASELVPLIDFDQLAQLNRSFIADTLREQESDILFSVPFQREEGTEELLIYILIEHQELIKLVEQHTPEMEVETMAKSMANILREQGIEQGKAEGIEQGETRAKQAAVLKLLQFRFDNIRTSIVDQVASIRSLARLDMLFEQVWDAETLDEIDFRGDNK